MKYFVLLGRVFFSAIFVMSAASHFNGSLVEYAANAGVPAPSILVPLSGILAVAGGLSIMLGYRARGGAWLIVLFLLPVTFFMHRFWGLTDPQAAMQQQIHFMKNLSMLGGAFLITWFGSGPLSLDSRRGRYGATLYTRTEAREKRAPVAAGGVGEVEV